MRKNLLRWLRKFPISNPTPHVHNYPRDFLDIEVYQKALGRVVFELYDDIAPRFVENFLRISDGVRVSKRKLHYKNASIDKILHLGGLWGGFLGFQLLKFMWIKGPAEDLSFKFVGFGQVLQGFEYIAQIEKLDGIAGVPLKKVLISNSGFFLMQSIIPMIKRILDIFCISYNQFNEFSKYIISEQGSHHKMP